MSSDFKPSGNVHGETDHVQSTDVHRTVEAPVGVWTDVRAGQVTAEGTVTRPEWPGILFDADDPTKVIVWHLKPAVFACGRRNIKPEQVVFEEGSGAPWCPTCLHKKKQILRKSKVKGGRKKKQLLDRLHAQTEAKRLPIKMPPKNATDKSTDSEIVWRENDERTGR
ncbi:hypothetical protein HWB99_gp101 [Mycobacterium phage DrLupo]|uniref:Uncharacterized protein n=1 Tax=Mycobacterium phage DrLupo TaxID=2499037 RepID=A0A3S9UQR2_9CAUD|nr:hypothetical protein HWB99_gp101 [Mycobacterium phage DrLupo]AZS12637.1 hypothetical protein SEA_DRLUPO_101 [Mycobacterium phage DrLupo]